MGMYQPKQLVGYAPCPECGYADAELKGDKNGDLYRWCPQEDCALQTFSRGKPARVKRMLAKMRPAASPEKAIGSTSPEPAIGSATPETAVKASPVEKKEPAPAKKKRAPFFSTLMDAES